MSEKLLHIKAIIGLGNPGSRFIFTRHNIGFRVIDALAQNYNASWQSRDIMELAQIEGDEHDILLIKPQTFMNDSGKVISFLLKKGIKAENILVVHDELEKKFGTVSIKQGGSARGHNGLRSIIEACGPDFWRLRCGIGRPDNKEMVGDYVLQKFSESDAQVEQLIADAVAEIDNVISGD